MFGSRRLREACATAAVGMLVAGGLTRRTSLAVPAVVVAGANGAVSGWRCIYDWRSHRGPVAFALDSTWALPMTAAGLVSHAVALIGPPAGYDETLSRRRNRHVYRRGFVPRKGFAITLGNVISGAGDTEHPGRCRLVNDHEAVHVWQARWFGPTFPMLYGGWMVLGGMVGGLVWLRRGRAERLIDVVETCAYYVNPFEWWAYSRDNRWPPSGKVAGLGWKQPMVRAFTT